MMNKGSVLWACLLLSACAGQSTIVLLPDESGKTGRLEVISAHGQRTLSQPYQATSSGRYMIDDEILEPGVVRERYGNVVGALPKAPQRFTLYFESGSDALTSDSLQQLAEIRAALAGFTAPELVVTGHTDRVGALGANDALSLKRAEQVRELLVNEGFVRESITVAGRGEREPAVPTEDEIAEPKNRRVEVKIR